MRTFVEFLHFIWQRKAWWLFPVVIVLFLLGLIIIAGGSSSVGPFIYTLF